MLRPLPKFLFILSFLLIMFSAQRSMAQTHTITHNVTWETENQNMWGPNGQPFTIDTNITLFWFDYDTLISINFIQNIFGGQFGAALDIDSWLDIGSVFSIHGFTTGSVDATYPVTIDLTFPDNYTFNPGSNVTINSDYEVLPGWDLTSHFPTAGVMQLDLFFGFGLDIDATICLWNCWTFSPINIQVPTDSINIFYLNSQTGEVAYPCWDGWFFAICHDTVLPIIIPDFWGIGLTASIDIPYIQTNDWLGADNCVYASGNDPWLTVNLDVIQFLSAIASLIPPPAGPAIQQFLGLMAGSINIGAGISIDYVLLSLNFGFTSYMVQDLTLCPTIWTTFDFPTNVNYTETDPASGALVDQGNDDVITIHTGNDLNFDYPCSGYPTWDMGIAHNMTNDFTNHLWDSMAFYFNVSAFEFWINIPSFPILPDLCVPEYCFDVPAPCHDKSPGDTCWQTICSPEICTPPVVLNPTDWQIHIGPLYAQTFPLGYIPITWFEQTWQLGGWTPNNTGIYDTIMPPHTIIPNPELTLDLAQTNPIICFGDTTGQLTATVQNGTPPYTYIWSTGDSTTTAATTNALSNLGTGFYGVTVTDANGCMLWDTMSIANVDPPLYISLMPTMVTCIGGSDGQILAMVTGGTPPYNYVWAPLGGNDSLASGLPAGTYWVIVTDIYGCQISDTASLTELFPLPPINFVSDITEGCQPLNVQFYETSPDEGQTYLWDFHDGSAGSVDKNPYHTFTEDGYYDITLYVTSIHGCLDSLTIDSMIWVHPKPVASFDPNPDEIDILDAGVYYLNTSDNLHYSFWTFGDGNTTSETSPFHNYMDTGSYNVILVVVSEFGCRDTTNKYLIVKEAFTFYAPNAFTPDHNGINEVFLVKGIGIDNSTFVMRIFDRWGAQLFTSYDIEEGWDGRVNGEIIRETGVFTYMITFKDVFRRKHKYVGTFILLK